MTEDAFPPPATPAVEGVVWGEMVEGPAHGKPGTGPSLRGPDRFPQALVRWGFLFLVGGLALSAVWLAVGVVEALQAENEWRLVSVRVTRVVAPAAAVLVFAAALAMRAHRGETRRLWHLSYAMAAIFVAGIATIWITLVREPYRPDPKDVVILTPEQREAFLRSRLASGPGAAPAAVIPTGVFLRTTEFERTENVRKSGYIWQKYADSLPGGLSREFVLPEAVETHVQEAYRRRVGDVETIGWYFEVETREIFNYTHFPFDIKDPWVRITPRDFDAGVLLVPDLESYASTDPRTLPGLERGFALPGWKVEQTFFSYKLRHYNTSFGVQAPIESDVPELYFTMAARRQFLSVFFLLVFPVLVMLVLIFMIVYNMPPRHLGGEGLYNIVRICGTYLFILILNHVNLRTYVSGGIVYLEYFYVLLYAGVLWVLLNAGLYLKGLNPPGLCWRENLIARLVFLPLLSGIMMVVTVATFGR
jgi:hypothetical protein